MLYFPTPDGRVKKIRASDGQVIWDTRIDDAPIVARMNAVLASDVVALARVDIVAVDTTTGAPRWTYVPADREETGDHALSANDSTIYASGNRGRLHAVNAATGAARWVVDLSEGRPEVGAFNPVVDGDFLFVCTKDGGVTPNTGTLWALDAMTGTIRWSHEFTPALTRLGSSCYGSPALWNDLVIQPQEDSRVFAFDRATGAVRWETPLIREPSLVGNDLRWAGVGGNTVVVSSLAGQGAIVAYDAATGTERWRRTTYGGSLFSPAADSEIVFVDHGWVFGAYDISTGASLWAIPLSFNSPATVYKGTPIIGVDRIFVAGRDGSYALRR